MRRLRTSITHREFGLLLRNLRLNSWFGFVEHFQANHLSDTHLDCVVSFTEIRGVSHLLDKNGSKLPFWIYDDASLQANLWFSWHFFWQFVRKLRRGEQGIHSQGTSTGV